MLFSPRIECRNGFSASVVLTVCPAESVVLILRPAESFVLIAVLSECFVQMMCSCDALRMLFLCCVVRSLA